MVLVIALSIIDLYNSHKPLARGYPVKYTDAWCSTFASAVAIQAGLTSIFCDWQDSGVGDNTGAAEKITKAGPRFQHAGERYRLPGGSWGYQHAGILGGTRSGLSQPGGFAVRPGRGGQIILGGKHHAGMSVKEVSHHTGYSDPLVFSKAFKRKFGISPKEYRTYEDQLETRQKRP